MVQKTVHSSAGNVPESIGNVVPAPMVSVIIPTYNRSDYLPKTLDSLIAQSFRDYEVLLVDDGSTDNTEQLVRRRPEPIRYFYQPNAGPAAARNYGIKEARGEFVAFLDSDDLWEPRFLGNMVGFLRSNPKIDIAFCQFITINDRDEIIERNSKKPYSGRIASRLFASTFITTPSIVARRKVIINEGGFNESMLTNEDYDLWLRLALKHEFGLVEEPLCLRRSHPGTQSRNGDPGPSIRKAEMLDNYYRQFGKQAGITPAVAHLRLGKVYHSAGKRSLKAGHFRQALRLLHSSLAYRPFAPDVWARYGLAAILVPIEPFFAKSQSQSE